LSPPGTPAAEMQLARIMAWGLISV
jgi:hypothetical protein